MSWIGRTTFITESATFEVHWGASAPTTTFSSFNLPLNGQINQWQGKRYWGTSCVHLECSETTHYRERLLLWTGPSIVLMISWFCVKLKLRSLIKLTFLQYTFYDTLVQIKLTNLFAFHLTIMVWTTTISLHKSYANTSTNRAGKEKSVPLFWKLLKEELMKRSHEDKLTHAL